MVDQAATKEEASDGANGEKSNEKKVALGNKAFRKKGFKGSNDSKRYEGVPDLMKGIVLLELDLICVYVCIMYKNGSDLEMCLDA